MMGINQDPYPPRYRAVPEPVQHLAQLIMRQGGRMYLVGGCVRDQLARRSTTRIVGVADYDIEVHNLTESAVVRVLTTFSEEVHAHGLTTLVGKRFGVWALRVPVLVAETKATTGRTIAGPDRLLQLDVSLPRTDQKVGPGHTGFVSNIDPFMGLPAALRRRDFTVNAIAMDPLSGELFDSYSGLDDLSAGVLRCVDPTTFVEDPLRVLRGAQFVSRFDFTVEPSTLTTMTSLKSQLTELHPERIGQEWCKLLDGRHPSRGLELLRQVGALEVLHPELQVMVATPQPAQWHPEGDVWQHTLLAVDKAEQLFNEPAMAGVTAGVDRMVVMLATLLHDIGKPATTKITDGKVTAHGHAEAGLQPAQRFLSHGLGRTLNDQTVDQVLKLIEHHMWIWNSYSSMTLDGKVSDGAFRKLARSLAPATMQQLALVTLADGMGARGHQEVGWFLERLANANQTLDTTPLDVIMGRDLIAAGMRPHKLFHTVINQANRLHDDHNVSRDQLLDLIRGVDAVQDLVKLFDNLLRDHIPQ